MTSAPRPRPIPPRFLKPRELDGSYPFIGHRTQAEIAAVLAEGNR
jgi:hypothetical protein